MGDGTRRKIGIGKRRALARKYGVEMTGQPHSVECIYCGTTGTVTWYPAGTPRRTGRWIGSYNNPTAEIEPSPVSWVRFRGIEIEHLQPVAGGGTNELENLALACAHCNVSKSDRTISEWLDLLATRSRHPRREAIIARFAEVA